MHGFRTLCLTVVLALSLAPLALAQQPTRSPADSGLTPWLGMNLSDVRDYMVQRPFIDVMKEARAWNAHLPGQWGGWEEADLIAAGALDADGWPIRVPSQVTAISTLILVDLPETAGGIAGNYRLTHDGEGALSIGGRVGGVRRTGRSEVWFSTSPGPGAVDLTISRIDPDNPLRNIRIVHENHIPDYEAGEIFNPDWIARINGVSALRFMDWARTNDSTLAQWGDRPRIDDYTWARKGVPLEVMVRLANKLRADPWFTLPHLADDDFFERHATELRDTLDPDLRAYIEFSNETWNGQFTQARHANEAAQARWGVEHAGQQFNAMRAARMVQVFNEVFEGQQDRLIRVLSTQTGWLGLENQLRAPLWQDEDPANPSPPTLFDAYGLTGYFSGLLGHPDKIDMTRAWIEESRAVAEAEGRAEGLSGTSLDAHVARHRFDRAIDRATQEIRVGSLSGDARDTVSAFFATILPHQQRFADEFGLDIVAYEAGTHLVGNDGLRDDDALTEFLIAVNYSDGMADLYTEFLTDWFRAGAGQYMHFIDVGTPSRWGSWGALRHLDDHNPRWQALVTFDPTLVTQ